MLDFTAIDFETASRRETSACSIGIAVVENGEIVDTRHYLIRPYPFYFLPGNIRIHGIEAHDVEDAPTFGALWPTIRPLLEGRILAAHNAQFDMRVLLGCLDYYELDRPDADILCSLRMSRIAYPNLSHHRLCDVCEHLGIPLDHHKADSDAEGCAGIILAIARELRLRSLGDIRKCLCLEPGTIRGGLYTPLKKWR